MTARWTRPQWCWLLYDVANAAFALVVRAVFAPLFFMLCAKDLWPKELATGYWGLVSSAAGIVAGVFSLYCGALADARGRRKGFLGLFLALGVAATLGLCRTGAGDGVAILWLYFGSLASYMIANSFYDSLLFAVAAPRDFHRLSSTAYGWGYVGGLIPFLLCLAVGWLLKDEFHTAKVAFVIGGVWWAALSVPLFAGVREKPEMRTVRWYDGFRELFRTARELGRYREALLFLVAYFLYIDGVSTILLMATPISVEIGIGQTVLLLTMLGVQIVGCPGTLLFGRLAERFGARRMVYAALAIYVVTALLVGGMTLTADTGVKTRLFLAVALLIATAQGGIQSLSRSLFGMLVPPEKASEFFGVYNIFGKFTTIVGPVLIYCASRWLGRSEYGVVMLIVPFVLGGWLLSRVKFPEEAKENDEIV